MLWQIISCNAILPTYVKQVFDTQERLSSWHKENGEKLNIDTEEKRRKREGIDGAINFIPGFFKENLNYKQMDRDTVNMITVQASGQETVHTEDIIDCTTKMCN